LTTPCHEQDAVQLTPWVERTTLSWAHRPRYERSQSRPLATSWLQPSSLTGPRRRNRWTSSSGLDRSAIKPPRFPPDRARARWYANRAGGGSRLGAARRGQPP